MTQVTIPPALGGDGLPFSDDGTSARDMQGQGYASHFFPMVNQVVAASATAVQAAGAIASGSTNTTSSTSLTIGTGARTLTVETGKALVPGMWVLLAYSAAPANNMTGQVTSYNAGTGALVINVTAVSGAGTYANWSGSVTGAPAAVPGITRADKTSAYTLTSADKGTLIDCSGTWVLGFAPAATLGAGWWCYVRNTSNGDITIDPDGSELIDGVATYTLKPGNSVMLTCDGTALGVMVIKKRAYDNRQLITTTSTFTVPADTYVIRPYAFGAGSAGIATSPGKGGGCAFGDIAVTPGEVVSFSIASGIAKVTTQSIDRLTANPAVTTTVGTATKHASVTNGGAYSGGSNGSGSPLGAGGFGLSLGLNPQTPPIDPLLFGLYGRDAPGGVPNRAGINGSPGGIGGDGGLSSGAGFQGGAGGFGCKGGNGSAAAGGGTSNGGDGGAGGFGGNGGNGGLSAQNSPSRGGAGGAGGFGGGGGGGGAATVSGIAGSPGAGGAAAIIIIY